MFKFRSKGSDLSEFVIGHRYSIFSFGRSQSSQYQKRTSFYSGSACSFTTQKYWVEEVKRVTDMQYFHLKVLSQINIGVAYSFTTQKYWLEEVKRGHEEHLSDRPMETFYPEVSKNLQYC